jgi:hypothetical protein
MNIFSLIFPAHWSGWLIIVLLVSSIILALTLKTVSYHLTHGLGRGFYRPVNLGRLMWNRLLGVGRSPWDVTQITALLATALWASTSSPNVVHPATSAAAGVTLLVTGLIVVLVTDVAAIAWRTRRFPNLGPRLEGSFELLKSRHQDIVGLTFAGLGPPRHPLFLI